MSATPPPPPPSTSSSPYNAAFSHAQGRAPPTMYRTAVATTHTRSSPYSRPASSPTPQHQQQQQQQQQHASHARWTNSGGAQGRPHTGGVPHVDPSPSRGAPGGSAAAAQQQQQQPTSRAPAQTTASTVSSALLSGLRASVLESLAVYMYTDAIDLAQRLFDLEATYAHLHLLAHCYVVSGAVATAHRLLQHHYPFLQAHVTRPRTAGGSTTSATVASLGSSGVSSAGVLPLDARRTWTAASHGARDSRASSPILPSMNAASFASSGATSTSVTDSFELGYETVDVRAQWDCQYLLGVCCYRTQRYEDGTKVLSQLLYAHHQVSTAAAVLRQRLQQQQQQQAAARAGGDGVEDAAEAAAAMRATERQLQSYSFITDAQTSPVHYWLGLCEQHRQRHPIAAEHFRHAYTAHPTRIDAFSRYVQMARPSEPTVQVLLAVPDSHVGAGESEDDDDGAAATAAAPATAAVMDGAAAQATAADVNRRPPQRRRRSDVEREQQQQLQTRALVSTAVLPPAPVTPSQRWRVQQHLRPYLYAAFLGLTYRCPEAAEALRALLLEQEQQQQCTAAAAMAASTGVGPHDQPRSTLVRLSSSFAAAAAATPSPWLQRQLALALFHNGDVQESADAFARLLRAAPWELTHPALIYYSTALWHLKDEGGLGSLAQRVTDAEPLSATTLCIAANAYSLIKDPRDALVMLRRAVQVAPTLAYAHALLGYELLGQDSKAEAEVAFKAALSLDASLYMAYAGLGERHVRDARLDKARSYYRAAVELCPTPAIVHRYALTYHRHGTSPSDLKIALRLYTDSLRRHPSNSSARRQRADVLLRLNRPHEAVEELTTLLAQCRGEAAVYIALAECMVCLRRPQEALQHYQAALRIDPHRDNYVQGCMDQLVVANLL
ncbi:Tetratricopeptide repeat [Novymonas esmeraldas]|uniref:Tetratricopeptide repeat n=1 Tax=Novymonas esmeraldas TaxID=1808958 RepID=A0AAW0EQF4_9TRYP